MASQCPVCRCDSERSSRRNADGTRIECVRCGRFDVDREFEEALCNKEGEWRWQLSSAIREATDDVGGLNEVVTTENYEEIIARSRRPKNAIDQVNRFILAVGRACTHVGAYTKP